MVLMVSAPPRPKWRTGGARRPPTPKGAEAAELPTIRAPQAMEGEHQTAKTSAQENEKELLDDIT